MSLQRFLNAITNVFPTDPLAGKEAAIAKLNPEKIYLENVRSALNVSTTLAQRICETAVRRGLFTKRIEVVCPDGTVAMLAENEAALPDVVKCWQEDGGEYTQVEFATKDLRKVLFYQMNYDAPATGAHVSTT